MKKLYFVFGLLIVSVLFSGCRSLDEIDERFANVKPAASMTPPVENKCKVASFSARVYQPFAGKDCKLDASAVPEVFRKEIEFYLTNGLNSKGIKVIASSKNICKVEFSDESLEWEKEIDGLAKANLRKSVLLKVTMLEKKTQCCVVETICKGNSRVPTNYWLAGLSAVSIRYLGQTKNGVQHVGRLPIELHAVTVVQK